MLVLSDNRQKDESIVVGDLVQITMAEVRGDKVRASLPKVQKEKVLAVRHHVAEGKYDINERVNVALDELTEDLITKRVQEDDEEKSTTRHQQKQNQNFSC